MEEEEKKEKPTQIQNDENQKYPTFDEQILDNNLFFQDENKTFDIEIRNSIYYINEFSKVIHKHLDNDYFLNYSLLEYGFRREKILLNLMFLERTIQIIYNLLCERRSIFNSQSIIDIQTVDEYTLSTDSDEIFKVVTRNKIIDISNDEESSIKENIIDLIDEERRIYSYYNTNKSISLSGIIICLKYLEVTMDNFLVIMNKFELTSKSKGETVNFKEETLNMFNYYNKIKHMKSFMIQSMNVPDDDLFNKSIVSYEWLSMKNQIETVILYSQDSMRMKINKIFDMIILASASVSKSHEIEAGALRSLGMGFYLTAYFFFKKNAIEQAKIFNTNPKLEVAKGVWSLLDTKTLRIGFKLTLPMIGYRRNVYIRRMKKEIDMDEIGFIVSNTENKDKLQDYINKYGRQKEIYESSQKGDLFFFRLDKNSVIRKPFVKVKLLHVSEIVTSIDSQGLLSFLCTRSNLRNNTRNCVIIHIHGGGFVSMSSTSHENYLRKFCISLKCPIISIDYGLSPENPYPHALNDVYQAYSFIISHAESEFNIEINKIILFGDSAGGCLAAGLVNLLISKGERLPDALFLAYPCLRLDSEFFSPSKILCLKDQILSISFLLLCLEAYIGDKSKEYDIKKDFFGSPIYTPSHYLRHYPKTRLYVGSHDPLRDDNFRLLRKLLDCNVDAKLYEFKFFPHGFLSYDMPTVVPEVSEVYPYILKEMEEVISSIFN